MARKLNFLPRTAGTGNPAADTNALATQLDALVDELDAKTTLTALSTADQTALFALLDARYAPKVPVIGTAGATNYPGINFPFDAVTNPNGFRPAAPTGPIVTHNIGFGYEYDPITNPTGYDPITFLPHQNTAPAPTAAPGGGPGSAGPVPSGGPGPSGPGSAGPVPSGPSFPYDPITNPGGYGNPNPTVGPDLPYDPVTNPGGFRP